MKSLGTFVVVAALLSPGVARADLDIGGEPARIFSIQPRPYRRCDADPADLLRRSYLVGRIQFAG